MAFVIPRSAKDHITGPNDKETGIEGFEKAFKDLGQYVSTTTSSALS